MKLRLVLTFFILLTSQAWGAKENAYDQKLLNVLKREYKAAYKLWKKEPNSRNYYRVYNSRVEILNLQGKKLREFQFKRKNSVAAKKLEKKNLAFYRKTKKFGDQIDQKFKKFANQGKFNLMQGLLIFEYDSSSRETERYLLKAIQTLRNKELRNNASGKLGDYYFNLRRYKKAISYYSLAMKIQPKSVWTDRYYYNMAWSFFKLDEFDKAVRSLYGIYKYSQKKNESNYFYGQSLKKIPEFYVFAGEPDKGFNFVKKTRVNDGRALFEYVQYVYNRGFFNKFDLYVGKLEELLKRKKKRNSLLSFRIEMYNFLVASEFKKSRKTMMKLRNDILSYLKEGKLDKDLVETFAQQNLKLLRENFKRINKKDFSRRDRYFKPILEDTVTLLETMMQVDPKKKFSYQIRYAQILRKVGKYKQALKSFEDLYQKRKNLKSKTSVKLLEEIIAIYSMKDIGIQADPKKEKQYYVNYLKYGKDAEARKIIYLKLYDIYYKEKQFQNAFKLTKEFYGRYPAEISQVELMLLKLATSAQETKNEGLIKGLKNYVASNPSLDKSGQLKKATSASYQNLVLGKINNLMNENKGDKEEIANKLLGFYQDSDIDRVNRMISGFNAGLIFHKMGSFSQAGNILGQIVAGSLPDEFSSYSPKITALASNGLMANPNYSLRILKAVYAKSCSLKTFSRDKDFLTYLESLLIQQRFSEIEAHVATIDSCKLKNDIRASVYSLVYEYTNFSDPEKMGLALSAIRVSSGQASVDDFIQEYIAYVFNEVATLEKNGFFGVFSTLESAFKGSSDSNSAVYRDFKNILSSGVEGVAYQSMPLSMTTLEAFLDKNLGLFIEKTTSLSKYETNYPLVRNLKDVVQLTLFENLFQFMEMEIAKIENPGEQGEIGSLINQALGAFEKKLESLKNSQIVKKDQYHLRYISLNQPENFIYTNKTFYSQGRE